MGITTMRVLGLILTFTFSVQNDPAYGSSSYKCKTPACDINAIGHRKLFNRGVGNWYSTEKQKELGKKYSAELEQRVQIVQDIDINAYVDHVAQRLAHNSDADVSITVRIIRTNDADAVSLIGGHLYLTTGLLLKLRSEGELASVLARGIAHTATYAVARLLTRGTLLQMADNPSIIPALGSGGLFGLLEFQRKFELEADYFGIQYVYKSGYDTDCFLDAVQTLWMPGSQTALAKAFDPFPPLTERMKMLQQEIDDILPEAPGAVVSTSEFEEFIGRVREIAPPESAPDTDRPKSIRHDSSSE